MKALLNNLSTIEKIGQLIQLPPHYYLNNLKVELTGPELDLNLSEDLIFKTGSVLGIGSYEDMMLIQSKYLEKSKHKIPLMFMADIIHGYETIFPVPIALASTWNLKHLFEMARISSLEAQTSGIHVSFAPMADITRDPRWGRVVETFGEDSYVTSLMSQEVVLGFQNDGLDKPGNIASCVKHYIGYGASEAGRDYNTVDISRWQLYHTYLPPFEKAIKAGARLIMTSFNVFEGIPATINKYLLKDILRKQLKFDGVIISDYASLLDTISHGISNNKKNIAKKALESTLDIEMVTTIYLETLKEIVDSDKTYMDLLNKSVLRVLNLKKDLGLFDNPYKAYQDKNVVRSKKHLEKAKQIALESIVLLKNDNHALPLNQSEPFILIGPFTHTKDLLGAWSYKGDINLNKSLDDILKLNENFNGSLQIKNHTQLTKDYLEKIEKVSTIVLTLGENSIETGEAKSKSQIRLPKEQIELLKFIKTLNKKIVVILFNGRPLILNEVNELSDAILETWFLGSMASEAIADILFGKTNPSGKLTISFPKNEGQIPIYYNHFNTGKPLVENNPNYMSRYLDIDNSPLYPFGYGLSYSNFIYTNLTLSDKKIKKNKSLKITVDIINESNVSGYEIIQLYIKDHFGEVIRPVKELKDFKKVWFEPYEKKSITFSLNYQDLKYVNQDLIKQVDPGYFTIYVGTNSVDCLEKEFYYEG